MSPQLLAFGLSGARNKYSCYYIRSPCELGPHLKHEEGQGCGWERAINICQVEKDQIINRKNVFNFSQGQCFVHIFLFYFPEKMTLVAS